MGVKLGATTIGGMYLGSTAINAAYLGATQVYSAGGAFTPAALFASSEEGAWYDPSDLSTLWRDTAGTVPVTAAGQSVARMDDKSGNGNHATQATTASQPTYETDGTYHWLEFDGVDDFMINVGLSVSRPVDVFTAYLINNSAKNQTAIDTRNSADRFFIGPNAGNNLFDSDATAGDIRSALSADTPYVISAFGSSPSGDELRVDGISVGTRTGGTHGFDGLTIADIRNALVSGYKLDGNIYGIIIRGVSSATEEITNTEAYLAAKSGVTL